VFTQITGSTRTNLTPTVVSGGEAVGCVSQESVIVFNDVAYFLWNDGVYRWDANGITCISNGKVRGWFATDDHFNRAMFWRSFAQFDPVNLKYRLFLASAGSTTINRWIEYDLITGAWWGPHKTTAFNPTCTVMVPGSNLKPFPMIGSQEGHLSKDDPTAKSDWGLASIPLSVKTRENVGGSPEEETYFGELSVFAKKGTGTLTVTPFLGDVGDTEETDPFSMDLSRGRQRLGRVGSGSSMQLQFDHDTIDQDVVLYGYTVDPVFPIGRR
jgi:hypothetical protein